MAGTDPSGYSPDCPSGEVCKKPKKKNSKKRDRRSIKGDTTPDTHWTNQPNSYNGADSAQESTIKSKLDDAPEGISTVDETIANMQAILAQTEGIDEVSIAPPLNEDLLSESRPLSGFINHDENYLIKQIRQFSRDMVALYRATELEGAAALGYGFKYKGTNGSEIGAQLKGAIGVNFTENNFERGFFFKFKVGIDVKSSIFDVSSGGIDAQGFFLPEYGHGYWKSPRITKAKFQIYNVNTSANNFEASITFQPFSFGIKVDSDKYRRYRNE